MSSQTIFYVSLFEGNVVLLIEQCLSRGTTRLNFYAGKYVDNLDYSAPCMRIIDEEGRTRLTRRGILSISRVYCELFMVLVAQTSSHSRRLEICYSFATISTGS